jgi:DNA-binding NarL/FixJ family response regulator
LPDLQKALQLIANGASFFPRQTERLRDQAENPLLYANSRDIQDPLKPLTTREREIFYLLACGLPNRSIARQHSLNPKTVQTHRAKMLKKLGLKSTAELVRFALKHDLIRN